MGLGAAHSFAGNKTSLSVEQFQAETAIPSRGPEYA